MSRLKFRRMVECIFGLLAGFLLLSMAGCASSGPVQPGRPATALPGGKVCGWWYESFRIDWPRGKAPAWSMDLLIAHRVVKPVLKLYGKDISLWRFHRRAARDKVGHQFSFIFYTTASHAREIYGAIESSPVLRQLKAKGLIAQVITDDTQKIGRPNIQDTSDPIWSLPLQKAWPYFIMGVSQTWLDLISQYANGARDKPRTLSEMETFYQKIDQQVGTAWRNEGGHAFLHHLNALFGYGPLNVTVRRKVELQF
ncbi:MAG: hypothetical protein P4L43_19235 [Syntrophobacteraceae bacterium]|nr:hypothetical protein [Syntrophobacteraceae bacterium]